MKKRSPGERLLFGCAACYQAVKQFKSGAGEFQLPRGYRFVSAIGTGTYALFGYVMESDNMVVAAFRGTENMFDLLTDVNWGQVPFPYRSGAGRTHRGFTELYGRSVRPQLHETLRRLSARKELIITGHSLGGAVALLAALDSALHKFRRQNVYMYGSPKVGSPEFVQACERNIAGIVRVENKYDWVPLFPPSNTGNVYVHAGKPVPITFRFASPLKNHQIQYYADALATAYPQARDELRKRYPDFLPN
jgi:triacylglycerol lipase